MTISPAAQYDVPLLPPRFAAQRADPAVVRRERAEEEAAERERQREEKEMRDPHSGVGIARRWRELDSSRRRRYSGTP
jgi:hypothetical protein